VTSLEPTRRTGLALAALGLSLAAPLAYVATMGVPFLLRTGAASWGVVAVGLAAGLAAARADRRLGIRILAGADVAIAAFWTFGFFGMAALPAAAAAERLQKAPDFTLQDEGGRPVSLAEARASGPVLLVFFRGAW